MTGRGAGPEADLIARCRRGEEAAWVELYRTHEHRVVRFLRFFLGPARDVEDLVQQVFVETVRSLERFRGDSALSTWLFGIARHVAELHQRTEFRRDRRRQAFAEWTDLVGPVAADPSSQVARREVLRSVADVLEGMDTRHRIVWLMVEVEGLSSREAAETLGIPAGTVRSRLFHARGEVLKALDVAGHHRSRDQGAPCVVTPLRRADPDKG